MFINGSIYIVNDISLVKNALMIPNNKILDLDEFGKDLDKMNPNIITSTCLLPPPDSIMAEIDGDHERFIESYRSYLSLDAISDFISVMIQSIHIGTNLVIYIPEMSEDTVWINELILHFMIRYGIKIGTSGTDVFAYDENYTSSNALILYMSGYTDPYEFLFYYVDPIFPPIQEKLIIDMKPYVIDNRYQEYFEELKIKLKKNPNTREAFTVI